MTPTGVELAVIFATLVIDVFGIGLMLPVHADA